MKNKILLLVPILMFGFANVANAAILYSQPITLSPGWNIVSTPKILESHSFSSAETSDNFDIYALDPSKTSGWATLSDLGQTEFTPLFGYFINNKTLTNQTLTFNYKGDTTPNQRLFQRTFPTTGWYSFGVANSSYVLSTKSATSTDTNNPNSILNALVVGQTTAYDTVVDFTNASSLININSVALVDPWKAAISSDIYNLNDFRETKGYAIYIKQANALYTGLQDISESVPLLTINTSGTGSGTVTGAGFYNYGTTVMATAIADANSTFVGWSGSCDIEGKVVMNSNETCTATFDLKTYRITASSGANGLVEPTEITGKNFGTSQIYTITPSVGYHVADVLVDNVSVGAVETYTFSNIIANHTISASFVGNTLTVTNSTTGLVSTAYEGDSKVAILGFKAEAQGSDIAIQRVKIDLGTTSKVYNAFYTKMYVTDESGNTLASSDLNSSTVVKDGTHYYVTFAGFNYVVSKGNDNAKRMYIKADLYSSIDSTDIALHSPQTITLADNGVRGVDGVGIDRYGPITGSDVTHAVIIAEIPNPATLTISSNSSAPRTNDVVCSSGVNENECDKLTLLTFDLKAGGGNVLITDMNIAVAKSGSGSATSPTVYLYDGSTELDSAAIINSIAMFNDINVTVNKDTTKTLTVKIDIRNANNVIANFIASASSTGIIAENSAGDPVTDKSGTATGNTIGVRNVGPEISLISKSITTSGVPQVVGTSAPSTSTLSATFNVKVKAVGGDIILGTVASTTPLFSKNNSFVVYKNGTASSVNSIISTSFTIPSTCTSFGTNSCTLAEGSEVTVPVAFQITGRNADGSALTSGIYSVGLEIINWGGSNYSNFMAGETDWRTADVSFP